MEDNEKHFAKFVRLQNGDDLITELVETEDDEGIRYNIFHPLKVVYVPSNTDGYLSISFMPWVFPSISDQQEFILQPEDILLIVDVSEKMNTYYWDSIDSYMNKSKKTEKESSYEENNMTPEEEVELYKKIMEQLAAKRTYH